ncbi:MAG: aminodeoxychorismate lyase [Cellvibrionales bacterium]|nr:aminodeoxychorismate lyase [Cellvibrionales bacterium]
MPPTWLINGTKQPQLPADNRALAYGDGLFETMRAIDGQIPLWKRHRTRLLHGCERLALDPDIDQIEKNLAQAKHLADNEQAVIKLILCRRGPATGYAPTSRAHETYIRIAALDMPPAAQSDPTQAGDAPPGLIARLCTQRLATQPALAGIKHLNRLEQVLAARELHPGEDEGILLDAEGRVAEAISSNLIGVIEGRHIFPQSSAAGVRGVMQALVHDYLNQTGQQTAIEPLDLPRLQQCEELLACNAVRGIRNIARIGDLWQSRTQQAGPALRTMLRKRVSSGFFSY